MRPGIGLDNNTTEPPRPRKPSNADSHPPSLVGDRDRHCNPATTFFLSRDPDASVKPHHSDRSAGGPSSTSPLSSLQDTIEEADRERPSIKHTTPRQAETSSVTRSGSRRRSTIKPGTNCERFRRGSSSANPEINAIPPQTLLERAVTPSPLPSRDISLPGSPKSLASRKSEQTRSSANSDDELLTNADETGSQAILSSGDEDENEARAGRVGGVEMLSSMGGGVQDSQPELIMPSIKMPSRRPFTERGKRLGRFKIMVAGRKGVGKTSLIKSIVQLCEDIVHVDPIMAASSSHASHRTPTSVSEAVNEVYASTKPYPVWWSTIEESRILRRRKSMGDSVLERNICFVDTGDSAKLERLVHYAEQQLVNAMVSVDQLTSEFSGLLSGRGASQVDVVLYLISKDTMQDDCECIRQLSELCNIIPLIAKSDLLTLEDQQYIKQSLDPSMSSLPRLPISIPSTAESVAFTPEPTQATATPPATAPFTVTSTNGPDLDTMDASLLMSPEYIQPLLPSELRLLVESMFEPETVAYLRHTAARKVVTWHLAHPRLTSVPSPSLPSQSYNASMRNSTLTSPLQTPLSTSNSGVLIPVGSEVSLNTSNSWALAKVADHTQREERLAQMRLSKWASELQLSLQRERERYERLARGERAVWLVERMGEEVRDGTIVPLQQGDNAQALVRKGGKIGRAYGVEVMPSYQMQDPLGLLRWQDSMRARGWIALQIVGSFGVVGGIAFWLAKHFGATSIVNEWWTQGWHYFGWHD
ncbi:uncharacterized protein Z520_00242 [Fonsecaea multimorphosa CBS 102226]|uniref:Septin-type G domain-containing protein n=1 Tax=Fonsecaea multimorphosa CBS 102226 TaxID=1442371 RepID=A0A0D2HNZ4_9EURO|nr:uncharacterized protein Z520_00242 [Fonsecaea multimorphosa CBS 102226]KIY03551.1 hypothetical protein Z520_00242 [Fonsecaea multimorphosa CBS 102226]OAL32255.1 hypothetical protein AYO22_00277 [Fonsecaea multimorphosa]